VSPPHAAPYKVKQPHSRALTRRGYYVRLSDLGNKSPSRRDSHRADVRMRKLNGLT